MRSRNYCRTFSPSYKYIDNNEVIRTKKLAEGPHCGCAGLATEAPLRISKTRFFMRDAFISARSTSVGFNCCSGTTNRTPSSLVISRSSLAVKAACGTHQSSVPLQNEALCCIFACCSAAHGPIGPNLRLHRLRPKKEFLNEHAC